MIRKTLVVLILFLLFLGIGCKKETSDSKKPESTKPDNTSIDWEVPVLPSLGSGFETFFNPTGVVEIHVAFTESEFNSMLNDYDKNSRNEIYRQATCTITGGGVDVSFPAVGIRLRGNTSRQRPEVGTGNHVVTNKLNRVHFKINLNYSFDKDESAYGAPSVDIPKNTVYKTQQIMENVAAINLKYNKDDPSYVREALSYDIYRNFGVDVVHTTYARLFIKIGDEAERYVGVYLAFEDIDKTWMKKRYSGNQGTMFKCLWQQFGPADLSQTDYDGNMLAGRIGEETSDPATNAIFTQGFSAYRPAYDLKEDFDGTGVSALNSLITLLNSNPTKEQLEAAIDVQSLLRAFAVNVMIGMADDYWRGGNNYYLFRNPVNQNKWTFLPYDNDRTFGINTFGPATISSSVIRWGDNSNTPCNPVLIKKILAIPQFMTDYKAYLAWMVDKGYFTKSVIEARIVEMQSAISGYTSNYDISSDAYVFSTNTTDISNYVTSRVAKVNSECR